MESNQLKEALHRMLGSLAAPEAAPDAQLLERFAVQRDEAAFAALVQRHGPMVHRLCQRMLANRFDGEDAFQATFIVLARLAGRINGPSLASWLYTVARRVARDARRSGSRRRQREQPLGEGAGAIAEQAPSAATMEGDLRPILDEELGRLPERYRAPMVLFYLEGRGIDEAAKELGLPRGTVASRMSRGRDLLRTRLVRRGLALSAPALAAELMESTASAAAPAAALQALASPVLTGGTALREGAAILAKESLQAMFWSKLRWGGIFLACLLMLGTATVKWTGASGKPAANANVAAAEGDEFYVRWRFDKGPPTDIRVRSGQWDWSRDAGKPGVMSVPGADLLLPTRIPKRPFVLSVKLRVKLRPQPATTSAHWLDGTKICACKQWYDEDLVVRSDPDGRFYQRFFFLGPWKLVRWDGERKAIVRLSRYHAPYPGQRMVLTIKNWFMEEIELRGLRPDELPAELRQPERATQTLTAGPDFP